VVDEGESGVDSRDEEKHTGRNDLLFVEKMMWMDEGESSRTRTDADHHQLKVGTRQAHPLGTMSRC